MSAMRWAATVVTLVFFSVPIYLLVNAQPGPSDQLFAEPPAVKTPRTRAEIEQLRSELRSEKHPAKKGFVHVKVFDKEGKLVGPVASARVFRTIAEWKGRLSHEQYLVTRGSKTERPFCGLLLNNKHAGVYTCVCCGLPLFASGTKFESGTGWPSFFEPIATENIAEKVDDSFGAHRIEIECARCDAHLGHVFNDGPPPTGKRYCLNSEALNFTAKEKLAALADPAAEASKHQESAVFAGGCFWCMEAAFEQLKGVLDVESGYSGGTKETADYEQVGSGRTGHAEAIRVNYDPRTINYEKLLDVFFDAHDPTELNEQGPDRGTQYRSEIFYANEVQKRAADSKIKRLTAARAFPDPIVTLVEPLKGFYPAEEYHQNYARRNPYQPYVQTQSLPRAAAVREKHPDLIKPRN